MILDKITCMIVCNSIIGYTQISSSRESLQRVINPTCWPRVYYSKPWNRGTSHPFGNPLGINFLWRQDPLLSIVGTENSTSWREWNKSPRCAQVLLIESDRNHIIGNLFRNFAKCSLIQTIFRLSYRYICWASSWATTAPSAIIRSRRTPRRSATPAIIPRPMP